MGITCNTHSLTYVSLPSQPLLVGVAPGKSELPVREAVEAVFGVVDEFRRPAILPEPGLYLVERLSPAAAPLAIRYAPHEGEATGRGEASHLLKRERNPEDRRYLCLYLTEEGQAFLGAQQALIEEEFERRLEDLSREELKELERMLSVVADGMKL